MSVLLSLIFLCVMFCLFLLFSMLNHNYFLWVLLRYNKFCCVGFSESCWSSLSISRGLERRGVRQRGKTRRRQIKWKKSTNFKICGSYVLTNYWFTKFMKLFFNFELVSLRRFIKELAEIKPYFKNTTKLQVDTDYYVDTSS